jgi:hypothetical protein
MSARILIASVVFLALIDFSFEGVGDGIRNIGGFSGYGTFDVGSRDFAL